MLSWPNGGLLLDPLETVSTLGIPISDKRQASVHNAMMESWLSPLSLPSPLRLPLWWTLAPMKSLKMVLFAMHLRRKKFIEIFVKIDAIWLMYCFSITWTEIGLNALGIGRHCSMAFNKSKSQRRKINSNTERFRWGNKCASISIALSEMRPVAVGGDEWSGSMRCNELVGKVGFHWIWNSNTSSFFGRLDVWGVRIVCWWFTWFRDGHTVYFTWRQCFDRFTRFVRSQSHCNCVLNSLLSF